MALIPFDDTFTNQNITIEF